MEKVNKNMEKTKKCPKTLGSEYMKFEIRWMEEKRVFVEANNEKEAYDDFISTYANKDLPEGELMNVSADSIKIKEAED